MKSLQDILAEVQALATVQEDRFESARATVESDVQALIDAQASTAPAADPVAEVTVTTQSGASTTFVPQNTTRKVKHDFAFPGL